MIEILQPHPVLATLSFGVITIHGFFFAVSAVCATLFAMRHSKDAGVGPGEFAEWGLWIFIWGLLGARIGYLVAYPEQWNDALQVLTIWEGGLLSYTGMVAGFFAALVLTRRLSSVKRAVVLDIVVISSLLAWGIGRWGNYFGYESYGIESDLFSVTYGRVPIQIFESLGSCILFVVFYALYRAKGDKTVGAGLIAYEGAIGYLVMRLVVDTWRDEAVISGMRASQWTCIAALLLIVPLFIRYRSRLRKR